MPEGWSTNRGLAQSLVEKGASLGMSLSAIQETLQEAGLGYKRTDIAADLRRIEGRRLYEEPISRLKPTSFVPVHMVEELPYNMSTNYWYRAKAVYTDPSTGEETERHFIWGSDDWLRGQAAIDELMDNVPVADYEANM
ncbi:MAG: hypothetical protein WAP47_21745, partial [Candidatus Rokuibacteriota bacterium]